ncbi:MAG TPA: DNA polymerase III subunit gamma and tau [Streptosporangiaceae bacterium]|nr:DNA polymerase III subunit gamma and tau [Streptosporangiaceae bacterium]
MAGEVTGTPPSAPTRPAGRPPSTGLALYRRYRPATFAEVKGQEHVTEPLRQALRNGRVHHAYLFSGPRGCGKTSSARILARSLNCVQGPTPDPCGVCESCVALAPSGAGSIDVIEIDAASHGGVDDARDLRERAFYAPVSGRFKVYIIDEAHMVTREGFNALLKLVEEPPAHLKFVFATTEPEKVIATIRSRTHHYPFRLVPPPVLRDHLEQILAAEGATYQPSVLPLVVRAGAGSVRDALSVLDQLLAGAGEEGLTYERAAVLLGYTDESLLDEMVEALAAVDGAAVFTALDRMVRSGHDPRRFAADLLDRLRDLIILAAVPGAGKTGLLDAPADRLETMAEQAGRFGQAELARAAEALSDGLIQMRGTTSPRLMLELTCAQMLLPSAVSSEKSLLTRLERLERGAGSTQPPQSQEAAPPARPAAPSHPSGHGEASRTEAGRERAAREGTARDRADRPGAGPEERADRPGAGREEAAVAGGERGPTAGGVGGSSASGPAPADVEALRQRWPDVLAAVMPRRKVTWILLQPATVVSLDNGVLTVGFPQEGNAKGFLSGGSDQVLADVLKESFGLNVRVVAVGSAQHPPVPADRVPRPTSGEAAPPSRPAGDAQATVSQPATSPAPKTPGRASTGAAAAKAAAQRGRRSAATPSARKADDDEWPDDVSGAAGSGTADSDPVELLKRQLGGRVIEEIEEA